MNNERGKERTVGNSLLRALVDLRDRQVQKARIQFGNRLAALERGADEGAGSGQREIVERWLAHFEELEAELDRDIKRAVVDEPIFEQLREVKGIGPMLAAKMIALIDVERAPTVSALWRYAGYGVVDGERERLVKGEAAHYNKRLKTTMYLVAGSFLKSGSPYRRVYDGARERYEVIRPEWTDGHRHLAAMRKMVKVFLSHLWERWRELEGLPTRRVYVEEVLRHTGIHRPEEFGWPEVSSD